MSDESGDWLDMLPEPIAQQVREAVEHALDADVVSVFEVSSTDDVLIAVPDWLLGPSMARGLCWSEMADLLATLLDANGEPLAHVYLARPPLTEQLVARLIASTS